MNYLEKSMTIKQRWLNMKRGKHTDHKEVEISLEMKNN